MEVSKDLPVGHEFTPVVREMTLERMCVFSDMEHSSTTGEGGELHMAPRNIHNDREFALGQGLPDMIADGAISTAWFEGLLRDAFGMGYLRGGRISTKFIKPVLADDTITMHMTVTENLQEGDRTRLVIDLKCTNQRGDVVTVGSGSGLI